MSEVAKIGRSIPESVAILARTDIIIGPYGGGLSYSFVMPERSSQLVVLGLALFHRKGKDVGTDHAQENDYGGMRRRLVATRRISNQRPSPLSDSQATKLN